MLTLDEVKQYLRVDSSEEDALIEGLIKTADLLVREVSRMDSKEDAPEASKAVLLTAELYTIAYLYEHREEADHHGLVITLRALLFGIREEKF
ncbi:head-tail connector protein [Bilifractor sp. LCP19S3_H10]|uniref:head-tail connector protein n=1 Tax=Lachnospiraceae TaxID=186803 RepID=UPI003F8E79B2